MKHLYLILFVLSFCLLGLLERDKQFFEEYNFLVNPGGEQGFAGWHASGGSVNIDKTTPGMGKVSLIWDASATGQFLRSDRFTVPEGHKGEPCEAKMLYNSNLGATGHLQLNVDDGTATNVASMDLEATTGYEEVRLSFTCPSSGIIRFEIQSTADAASIRLDSMYLGIARAATGVKAINARPVMGEDDANQNLILKGPVTKTGDTVSIPTIGGTAVNFDVSGGTMTSQVTDDELGDATAEASNTAVAPSRRSVAAEFDTERARITALENAPAGASISDDDLEDAADESTTVGASRRSIAAEFDTERSRIESLEATQTTQDTSITALQTTQGTQGTSITGLQTEQTSQGTRIGTLETARTANEGRITVLEGEPVVSLDPAEQNTIHLGTPTINNNVLSFPTVGGTAETVTIPMAGASVTDDDLGDATAEDSNTAIGASRRSIAAEFDGVKATQTTQGTSITALQTTQGTQGTSITALQTTQTAQGTSITGLQTEQTSQGTRIGTLETTQGTQGTSITALQTEQTSQGTRITDLEGKPVASLDADDQNLILQGQPGFANNILSFPTIGPDSLDINIGTMDIDFTGTTVNPVAEDRLLIGDRTLVDNLSGLSRASGDDESSTVYDTGTSFSLNYASDGTDRFLIGKTFGSNTYKTYNFGTDTFSTPTARGSAWGFAWNSNDNKLYFTDGDNLFRIDVDSTTAESLGTRPQFLLDARPGVASQIRNGIWYFLNNSNEIPSIQGPNIRAMRISDLTRQESLEPDISSIPNPKGFAISNTHFLFTSSDNNNLYASQISTLSTPSVVPGITFPQNYSDITIDNEGNLWGAWNDTGDSAYRLEKYDAAAQIAQFNTAPVTIENVIGNTVGLPSSPSGTAILSVQINYTGDVPTATDEIGSWVSSVTRVNEAETMINITSGICRSTPDHDINCDVSVRGNNTDRAGEIVSESDSQVTIQTFDTTNGNDSQGNFNLICICEAPQ